MRIICDACLEGRAKCRTQAQRDAFGRKTTAKNYMAQQRRNETIKTRR